MPPLPKRKLSKGRRDRRRSQDGLQAVQMVRCSNCNEYRRPHEVCANCGYYKGEAVVEMKSEKE